MLFLSCAVHREGSPRAEARCVPEHWGRARARVRPQSENESVSTACLEAQREIRAVRESCASIGPAFLNDDDRTAGRQAHRGGLRSAWHSKKQRLNCEPDP